MKWVKIVGAELRDPVCVNRVFSTGLKHALKRDQAHQRERWQQDHSERVKRGTELGRLTYEAERDQAARHRSEKHTRTPDRLRDRRGAGALQREVLGRDECHRRRSWLVSRLNGVR